MKLHIPKNSEAVYRILISEDKMVPAQRLATLAGIQHQNVYKAVKPLVALGLVIEGKVIVRSYRAVQRNYARAAYLRAAEAEFGRLFGQLYDQHDK